MIGAMFTRRSLSYSASFYGVNFLHQAPSLLQNGRQRSSSRIGFFLGDEPICIA